MRSIIICRMFSCPVVLFFTLLTVLNNGPAYAGDDIDSLKRVVREQKDDIEKADNLLTIGVQYFRKMMTDSAMWYYNASYDLAEELKYEKGIAEAEYKKSLLFSVMGDYDEAAEGVRRFIVMSESLGDSSMMAKGYYHYGNVVSEFGEIDSSINLYKKGLGYFLGLQNSFGIMASHNALGSSFKNISEFDSAAYYYLEAARIADTIGAEYQLATIWYNIGVVYSAMEDYDKAKLYMFKSLEINDKLGQIEGLANNFVHLGNTALIQGDLDSAMYYLVKADSLKTILGDRHGMANIYNSYGEVYERRGEYGRALESYKEALGFYREQEHALGLLISFKNIADIYSLQGRYSTARQYYDSALQLAESSGYRSEKINVMSALSANYYRAGNYKQAYDYLEMKQKLADSIFSMEKAEMIAELTMKYEKERDQARILKLENENLEKEVDLRKRTIQRNLILFTGLGLILLVLFISLYIRQRAVKDRQIAEQRIRRLEEEKKVLAAKALVEGQEEERKRIARELHDGLGVLLSTTRMQFSTIGDRSPEAKPLIEKAKKLLEQASSDVRRISHNMMPGLLTKLGLYEAVEDLVDKLRSTEGLTVEAEIPETAGRLPENKEIMIYRIMQEIINNTLKHAGAKKISLKMKLQDNSLGIVYSDDGAGFDVEKVTEAKTAGLGSIRSRVNFLNGKLELGSAPGKGTRYTMEIPI